MKQCSCGQFWKSCEYCQDKKESPETTKKRDYMRERRMKKELTKQEKLDAAFEIMCSGILYMPEGCTQKIGTFKNGCGQCGKGMRLKCLTPPVSGTKIE